MIFLVGTLHACCWIYYRCRFFLYSHCHIFKTIQLPISINMTCHEDLYCKLDKTWHLFSPVVQLHICIFAIPWMLHKRFSEILRFAEKKTQTLLIFVHYTFTCSICLPGTCFRGFYRSKESSNSKNNFPHSFTFCFCYHTTYNKNKSLMQPLKLHRL